jgi:hypothetical protein
MGARSTDEVKREIEHEREKLGDAVHTLRTQAGSAGRKLSVAALGAAGVGLAARLLRRKSKGKQKRARFPFLDSN